MGFQVNFENFEELITDAISLSPIEDPVLAPCCGNSFERDMIIQVLAKKNVCPLCRGELNKEKLTTNLTLKNVISLIQPKKLSLDAVVSAGICGELKTFSIEKIEEVVAGSSIEKIKRLFTKQMEKGYKLNHIMERFIEPMDGKVKTACIDRLTVAYQGLVIERNNRKVEKFEETVQALQQSYGESSAKSVKKQQELESSNNRLQADLQQMQDVWVGAQIGVGVTATALFIGGPALAGVVLKACQGSILTTTVVYGGAMGTGGVAGGAAGAAYNKYYRT